MASPPCGRASEKFSGGAREAAAGMERAVRAAKRAAGGTTDNISTRPPPVRWAALGLAEWRKQGALSVFRLKKGGQSAVHARTRRGEDRRGRAGQGTGDSAVVRGGGRRGGARLMPAGELLAASDAALAGVLYYDGRRARRCDPCGWEETRRRCRHATDCRWRRQWNWRIAATTRRRCP
eukprot:446254-Pleurochrysis_carterae.AAC.1